MQRKGGTRAYIRPDLRGLQAATFYKVLFTVAALDEVLRDVLLNDSKFALADDVWLFVGQFGACVCEK